MNHLFTKLLAFLFVGCTVVFPFIFGIKDQYFWPVLLAGASPMLAIMLWIVIDWSSSSRRYNKPTLPLKEEFKSLIQRQRWIHDRPVSNGLVVFRPERF